MILAIYCGGGLGREVLELAYQINDIEHKWDKIVFCDDVITDAAINGAEKFSFEEIKKCFSPGDVKFIIATGEPQIRDMLYHKVKDSGYSLDTLIHPDVHISETTAVGEGVVIYNNVIITCNVSIGDNVFFQPFSDVGHDTIIGDSCVISTYSAICGHCEIGKCTYIAVHSGIKQNIKIGSNCIIGMGSIVLRNVADNNVVLGNPGRVIRTNDNGRVF